MALLLTAPSLAQDPPRYKPRPVVTLETTQGIIRLILYPEVTPRTVANFLQRVKSGGYNGVAFTRKDDAVVQAGKPGTTSLPRERTGMLRHNRGAVGMTRQGAGSDTTQFYIVVNRPAPDRDTAGSDGLSQNTVFGQVVEGQKIAEKLKAGDKIKKATVRL